jgi:hypothetical protein
MAETAKTTTVASQVQQLPGMDAWKKMIDDQNARLGQMVDEMGKAHSKYIEYGNNQLDELSDLAKTQFNYVNELLTGFRKLSFDTTKKAMEFFVR